MGDLRDHPLLRPQAGPGRGTIAYWQWGLISLLLALYGYFLFYHLGSHAFIVWDESIYAQVAKEALLNRHYLSFTFWGSPWFDKPPLMVWVTVLGYKIFGINELGGRFFVALFGLGTIILTLLLVKKISRSFLAVFLALASFALCYQFFFQSYFLSFDIPVTFFAVLSVYAFLLALERPRYFYLFFAALGLGVLTKSVIGLLPVPILLIYVLASRQLKRLNSRHLFYGLGLAAAVALPWHVWETIRFGRGFWDAYLVYHVVERYIRPLENNGGPFSYYFPALWQNSVFALLLAISAAYFVLQSLRKNYSYFLLFLAATFIFLFFSLAQTKSYAYIVVIYPYVAAMFGITLADLLGRVPSKYLKAAAISILVLVFVGLGWQEQNFKILRLENSGEAMAYAANKNIAAVINKTYPGKAVYVNSPAEGNPAFEYYLGRTVTSLPANLALPANFNDGSRYRVFHQVKRSVYYFPGYLYIAQ